MLTHPGYDTRRAREDVDVVFPLAALARMAERGVIGSFAATAYSWMGYVPDPVRLVSERAPMMARELVADAVDLVLLVPA